MDEDPKQRGPERVTLGLLLIGGIFLPVVGWLIGVFRLWRSDLWTRRDKLIGTFVVPGGLLLPLWVLAYYVGGAGWGACPGEAFRTLPDGRDQLVRPELCVYDMTGDEAAVLVVGLGIAAIASVFYLARRRSDVGLPPEVAAPQA